MTDLALSVELTQLRRRVDGLEGLLYGGPRKRASADQAFELYLEAIRTLGHGKVTDSAIMHWSHAFLTMDEKILLELARKTNDPFPWRPLLQLATRMAKVDDRVELRGAVAHLRTVARRLLDAQGLEVVQVDDLLQTTSSVWPVGG